MNKNIVDAMADLEDEKLYKLVEDELKKGTDKLEIVPSLQRGMEIVGERFSSKDYYIGDLMMSAEMFQKCSDLFGSDEEAEPIYGSFILGTVESDLHDIGKNIVHTIFACNGFKVIDLGIDVPVEKFIEAIKEHDAKVIGLSCLLTTTFESLKKTVDAIRAAGLDKGRLILIGGGPCDEHTLTYSGADALAADAQDGFYKARDFVTK